MMQQTIQNFTYTSRATELGRGTKTKKMDMVPEWTPGPGAYEQKTDFQKRLTEKVIPAEAEDQQEIVEIVPSWDQKGPR